MGRTRLLAVFNADGSLKYRFNYADDRMPVSMTADGQTYYLAYDQVGSLRAVTDANGLVVKVIEYDSFGNVLEDKNPALDVPFGFAGGLYDADTGLVRFGFRDYDAVVGRWTAKDPIGFGGGDSDLYGYCGGDSIGLFDSQGLLVTFNIGYDVEVMAGFFGMSVHFGTIVGFDGCNCKYATYCFKSGIGVQLSGAKEFGFNHSRRGWAAFEGRSIGMSVAPPAVITGSIAFGKKTVGGAISIGPSFGASEAADICHTKLFDCECSPLPCETFGK